VSRAELSPTFPACEVFGAGKEYILPKSRCKHEYDARPILSAFQIPGNGQTLPLEIIRAKNPERLSPIIAIAVALRYDARVVLQISPEN
jgi:hypothetical protein